MQHVATTPSFEPSALGTSTTGGGRSYFVILITLAATIGGFLFGYDSGVINGTVDGLQAAFHSNSVGTGFNVACILLGCAAGAFIAGWMADKFGRRTILIAAAVGFAISAVGAGLSSTSMQFVFFRMLGGLSVGAASVLTPTYISEVAPAKYRGTLSSIQQIAIITGLTASYTSNYLLARIAGGSTAILGWGFEAWRWMFWVMSIPSAAFFSSLLFIPESPRFLVASGKKAKALHVLTRLLGSDAQAKLEQIDASLLSDRGRPRLTDILDRKRLLRPIIWVGVGVAGFQQLSGVNVVYYYGAVLWQSAGFKESDALLIDILMGVVGMIGSIVATVLIDRVGRRPLLLFGTIGMALTLASLTVVFATAETNDKVLALAGGSDAVALIAANLFILLFNLSWGPVMWVMLGEMFPYQLRGAGMAVSGVSQWMSNFVITMSFPLLLSGVGLAGAYGIYTAFAVVSVVFVLGFIVETRGKELEEMQG